MAKARRWLGPARDFVEAVCSSCGNGHIGKGPLGAVAALVGEKEPRSRNGPSGRIVDFNPVGVVTIFIEPPTVAVGNELTDRELGVDIPQATKADA